MPIGAVYPPFGNYLQPHTFAHIHKRFERLMAAGLQRSLNKSRV